MIYFPTLFKFDEQSIERSRKTPNYNSKKNAPRRRIKNNSSGNGKWFNAARTPPQQICRRGCFALSCGLQKTQPIAAHGEDIYNLTWQIWLQGSHGLVNSMTQGWGCCSPLFSVVFDSDSSIVVTKRQSYFPAFHVGDNVQRQEKGTSSFLREENFPKPSERCLLRS